MTFSEPLAERTDIGQKFQVATAEGQPVALFAEGTTGDGVGLRPFRASLLAALSPPLPRVVMQPVALDYGADAPRLAWGDTGIGEEMMRVMGLPGRRTVVVRFLAPIDPAASDDRKALALHAERQIAAALASGD